MPPDRPRGNLQTCHGDLFRVELPAEPDDGRIDFDGVDLLNRDQVGLHELVDRHAVLGGPAVFDVRDVEVLAGEALERALDRLLGGGGKVFFANSGAEANECALKLARRWGGGEHGRWQVISAYGSFHGRTLAVVGTGRATAQIRTGQRLRVDGLTPSAFAMSSRDA